MFLAACINAIRSKSKQAQTQTGCKDIPLGSKCGNNIAVPSLTNRSRVRTVVCCGMAHDFFRIPSGFETHGATRILPTSESPISATSGAPHLNFDTTSKWRTKFCCNSYSRGQLEAAVSQPSAARHLFIVILCFLSIAFTSQAKAQEEHREKNRLVVQQQADVYISATLNQVLSEYQNELRSHKQFVAEDYLRSHPGLVSCHIHLGVHSVILFQFTDDTTTLSAFTAPLSQPLPLVGLIAFSAPRSGTVLSAAPRALDLSLQVTIIPHNVALDSQKAVLQDLLRKGAHSGAATTEDESDGLSRPTMYLAMMLSDHANKLFLVPLQDINSLLDFIERITWQSEEAHVPDGSKLPEQPDSSVTTLTSVLSMIENAEVLFFARFVLSGFSLSGSIAARATLRMLESYAHLPVSAVTFGAFYFADEIKRAQWEQTSAQNSLSYFLHVVKEDDPMPSLVNLAQRLRLLNIAFVSKVITKVTNGFQYGCKGLNYLFGGFVGPLCSVMPNPDDAVGVATAIYDNGIRFAEQYEDASGRFVPIGLFAFIVPRRLDDHRGLTLEISSTLAVIEKKLRDNVAQITSLKQLETIHNMLSYFSQVQSLFRSRLVPKFVFDSPKDGSRRRNSPFFGALNTGTKTRQSLQRFLAVRPRLGLSDPDAALQDALIYRSKLIEPQMDSRWTMHGLTFALTGSSEIPVQQELFQLLSERHILAPMLIERQDPAAGNGLSQTSIRSLVSVFSESELALHKNSYNTVILGSNEALMRILVVSLSAKRATQLTAFLSAVLHCESIVQKDLSRGLPLTFESLVEGGIGHIVQGTKHDVVVMHVVGDQATFLPPLVQYADVLVIELDAEKGTAVVPELLSSIYSENPGLLARTIAWLSKADVDSSRQPSQSQPQFKFAFEVFGPIYAEKVSATLQQHLLHFLLGSHLGKFASWRLRPNRPMLRDLSFNLAECNAGTCTLGNDRFAVEFDEMPKLPFSLNSSVTDVRPTLVLSPSFEREAAARLKHPIDLQDSIPEVVQEKEYRKLNAPSVFNIPLMQQFIQILNESSSAARIVCWRQFQRELDQFMLPYNQERTLKAVGLQERARSYDYNTQKSEKDKATTEYLAAKQELLNVQLATEHLWRELGLVYSSDPEKYPQLPLLAAQHLLDGFPLELLNGDAMYRNAEWIKQVLLSLDSELSKNGKPSKILVLSILGVQSVGKSSLLMLMFGIRFRISVGACTRGINMALIKVEDGFAKLLGFDYVLLLDSEGINAPEFIGLEGSVTRDNFLGTYVILSADATIVLSQGEAMTAISNMLPLVRYIYQTNAKRFDDRLPSLLFFLFNQMRQDQQDKVRNQLQQSADRLRNLFDLAFDFDRHLTEIGIRGRKREPSPQERIASVYYRSEDFTSSDLFSLGSIMTDQGTPNEAYGDAARMIIDHILTEVADPAQRYAKIMQAENRTQSANTTLVFDPRTLASFVHDLDRVEESCKVAQNLQTFDSLVDRAYANQFQTKFASLVDSLNWAVAQQQTFLQDLIGTASRNASLQQLDLQQESFLKQAQKRMQQEILSLTDQLNNLLKRKENQRLWANGANIHWQIATGDVDSKLRRYIQQEISRAAFRSKSEQYARTLTQMLREKLHAQSSTSGTSSCATFDSMSSLFEQCFEAVSASVKELHPLLDIHAEVLSVVKLNDGFYQLYKQGEVLLRQDQMPPSSPWFSWTRSNSDQLPWQKDEKWMAANSSLHQILDWMSKELTASPLRTLQYESKLVISIMTFTLEQLANDGVVFVDYRARVVTHVYNQMVQMLQQQQTAYEQKTAFFYQFIEKKSNFFADFQDICEGVEPARRVLNTITRVFSANWLGSFQEHLASSVVNLVNVKMHPWLRDANIMQAYVDLDLIASLNSSNIRQVIGDINDPAAHYDRVMQNLFVKHYLSQEAILNVWNDFVTLVNQTACAAVQFAEAVPTRSAESLLEHLRRMPRKLSEMGHLSVLDANMSGDASLPVYRTLPQLLLQELRNSTEGMLHPINSSLLPAIFRSVIEISAGIASILPRCRFTCPVCKESCRLHRNHEGPHRTGHRQAAGLAGLINQKTRELASTHCSAGVERSHLLDIKGVRRSYHDHFKAQFPKWELPGTDLLGLYVSPATYDLRQFVWENFQSHLAHYFTNLFAQQVKPNLEPSKIPPPFAAQLTLDLCFAIDCTSSMRYEIAAVKEMVKSFASQVVQTCRASGVPNVVIRLAVSAYRDFNDPPKIKQLENLDFTENIQDFYTFVGNLSAEGGGDPPEDVQSGLEQAMSLAWSPKANAKMIVLIADAPAHQEQLDNGLEKVVTQIKDEKIHFVFTEITPYTDVMKALMMRWYDDANEDLALKVLSLRGIERETSKIVPVLLPQMTQAVTMALLEKKAGSKSVIETTSATILPPAFPELTESQRRVLFEIEEALLSNINNSTAI